MRIKILRLVLIKMCLDIHSLKKCTFVLKTQFYSCGWNYISLIYWTLVIAYLTRVCLFFICKEGKYSKPDWKAPVELWNVQNISERNFWFLNKSSKEESTKSEKMDQPKRGEHVRLRVKMIYFCKYIMWIILLKVFKYMYILIVSTKHKNYISFTYRVLHGYSLVLIIIKNFGEEGIRHTALMFITCCH